jgi:hypothetical protein
VAEHAGSAVERAQVPKTTRGKMRKALETARKQQQAKVEKKKKVEKKLKKRNKKTE